MDAYERQVEEEKEALDAFMSVLRDGKEQQSDYEDIQALAKASKVKTPLTAPDLVRATQGGGSGDAVKALLRSEASLHGVRKTYTHAQMVDSGVVVAVKVQVYMDEAGRKAL